MKRLLLPLFILISVASFSQKGSLVADSLHGRLDTVKAKAIVYLKWDKKSPVSIAVDSGYAVVNTCQMMFVGEDGKKIPTAGSSTLWTKIFVMPGKKEIDNNDLIKFSPKDK